MHGTTQAALESGCVRWIGTRKEHRLSSFRNCSQRNLPFSLRRLPVNDLASQLADMSGTASRSRLSSCSHVMGSLDVSRKGFRWMSSTKGESKGRREVGGKTRGRARLGLQEMELNVDPTCVIVISRRAREGLDSSSRRNKSNSAGEGCALCEASVQQPSQAQ